MKRQLIEVDGVLSELDVPLLSGAGAVQQVNALYESCEELLLKKKRVDVAVNAEPQIVQRTLRLYFRHEYYSAPENDRPYFCLYVEGLVLDGTKSGALPLSTFFERVTIQTQTEKKSNVGAQSLDWKEDDLVGSGAHCFRAKVYADKATPIKINLYRSNDVCARYNISDQLRFLLPYIRMDPSEEEVLLAMWQYFEAYNLIGADKDRRYVKLTEPLKELFYGNKDYHSPSILISSLRTRLLPHLVLARPLVVDHLLNTVNTPELVSLSLKNNYSLTGGGRWPTSIAYARVGGRVFDVEVDVLDAACYDVLHAINRCAAKEYEVDDRVRTHLEKLAYLARRMQVVVQDRRDLQAALAELVAAVAALDDRDVKMEESTAVPVVTPPPSAPVALVSVDAACIYERIRKRGPTERVDMPMRSSTTSPRGATAPGASVGANESKDAREVKAEPAAAVRPPQPGQAGVPSAMSTGPGAAPGQRPGFSQPPVRPQMGVPSAGAMQGRPGAPAASNTAPSGPKGEALATHCTSLHTLTGYLDIGDDGLFGRDSAWVRPGCERLVASRAKAVKTEATK